MYLCNLIKYLFKNISISKGIINAEWSYGLMVLWCSGLALETLNLASWVRIPVRPIFY